MKKHTLTEVSFIFLMLAACKKQYNYYRPKPGTKWNVVVDSTYFPYTGAPKATKYAGVAGDYFDFRTDNKCYIKEGNSYDTVAYTILTDITLLIQLFGYASEQGKIKNNTANSISITTSSLANPFNGFVGRTVNWQSKLRD